MGVLTLTAGLAGCGGGGNDDNEVNIGYFNNVTHAQALYMKANCTLEEAFGEDTSVAWTAFNAGPAEVEALFAGDMISDTSDRCRPSAPTLIPRGMCR